MYFDNRNSRDELPSAKKAETPGGMGAQETSQFSNQFFDAPTPLEGLLTLGDNGISRLIHNTILSEVPGKSFPYQEIIDSLKASPALTESYLPPLLRAASHVAACFLDDGSFIALPQCQENCAEFLEFCEELAMEGRKEQTALQPLLLMGKRAAQLLEHPERLHFLEEAVFGRVILSTSSTLEMCYLSGISTSETEIPEFEDLHSLTLSTFRSIAQSLLRSELSCLHSIYDGVELVDRVFLFLGKHDTDRFNTLLKQELFSCAEDWENYSLEEGGKFYEALLRYGVKSLISSPDRRSLAPFATRMLDEHLGIPGTGELVLFLFTENPCSAPPYLEQLFHSASKGAFVDELMTVLSAEDLRFRVALAAARLPDEVVDEGLEYLSEELFQYDRLTARQRYHLELFQKELLEHRSRKLNTSR